MSMSLDVACTVVEFCIKFGIEKKDAKILYSRLRDDLGWYGFSDEDEQATIERDIDYEWDAHNVKQSF